MACLLVAAAHPGTPAGAQEVQGKKKPKYQAWTQVPEYDVRIGVKFNKQFTQVWDWHGSTHDFDMNIDMVASGKVEYFMNNGRYWQWYGYLQCQATYTMDEHWYTPLDTLGIVHEEASGTDASGLGLYCHLVIDQETGTYDLVVTHMFMQGTVTSNHGEGTYTWPAHFHIPIPDRRGIPLEAPKPPRSFSGVIPYSAPPHWRLADPYMADLEVTYSFGPKGPKPEFLLKQPSVAKWLPTPDATVPVTVIPKKPGQTPAPVRFILEETSTEPGTCLNSPETDTNPDLEFVPAAGFELPEVDGTTTTMETSQPVQTATATVKARDYGAWTKVRAEAQIDGEWQPIPVQGSKLDYVTLPLDVDGNKIADFWEKQNRVSGRPTTWDEEARPLLDGTPGDGITLYEEYRGAMVDGQHQRLSPAVKELAVENQIGAQAKAGIQMLGSASGLRVLVLKPGELAADRVFNVNSTLGFVKQQRGLRLVNASLEPGTLGEAAPVEVTDKRPADCVEVRVDMAQIMASPPPIDRAAELNNTIAHELAHGIGASHHGEAPAPLIERFLTSYHQPPAHTVVGSDGVIIPDRPFQIQGSIAGAHGSLASGDTNCIMCYNSYYQWAVHRNPQGQYAYLAQQYRRPGTRFCTSATGTGVNGPKNKPLPAFGNAERGNCLSQLCPKDR